MELRMFWPLLLLPDPYGDVHGVHAAGVGIMSLSQPISHVGMGFKHGGKM